MRLVDNMSSDGYFILNKPDGMTSAQAIAKLKRLLPKGTKIGHTGTLDPNATGVLVVALGQATKSIPYLNFLKKSDKKYRVRMKFGYETDTLDIWGEVTDYASVVNLHLEKIEIALQSFLGVQKQIPPMYSALKKDGKRLYELAREGVEIEREAREIEIFSFERVNFCEESCELSFDVSCSKGTYVRSLCADIARTLGTLGTMSCLMRLKSDCFEIDRAISLQDIDERILSENISDFNEVFAEFTPIELNFTYAQHVLNGVKVDLSRFLKEDVYNALKHSNASVDKERTDRDPECYRVLYCGRCIALASEKKDGRILADVRFASAADIKF